MQIAQNKTEEIFEFAKDLLQDTFPKNFVVPTLNFSEERKTRMYGKYAWNMVAREEERLANVQDKATLAKLADMRANVKVVLPLKGSFNPDTGIRLYLCNSCEYCSLNGLDLEKYLVSVLAHEFFHAIHYLACAKVHNWEVGSAARRSFWRGEGCVTQKVATVRESLAEYFRLCWITRQEDEQLLKLFHAELQTPHAVAPCFPYAGVKQLLKLEQEEVWEMFEKALLNWNDVHILPKYK